MRRQHAVGVALVGVLAGALGAPVAASASPRLLGGPPGRPALHERVACSATSMMNVRNGLLAQLGGRTKQLTALAVLVERDPSLMAADRSTLATDLANESAGISALQASATTASTCTDVLDDWRAMVHNFRVFVVMTPQVTITIAADSESAVVASLEALQPRAAATIARADAAGQDISQAQGAYAAEISELNLAQETISGITGTVLGFTPASYPGCWPTFLSEQQLLQAGDADLHAAAADLRQVLTSLSPHSASNITTSAPTP